MRGDFVQMGFWCNLVLMCTSMVLLVFRIVRFVLPRASCFLADEALLGASMHPHRRSSSKC